MTDSSQAGLVLVLGGARSGKSTIAERLVEKSGLPATYVATAKAGDREMQDRIARHRERRPANWTTVEAPYDVAGVFVQDSPRAYVVDCLTLYISNWLLALERQGLAGTSLEEACLAKVDALIEAAGKAPGPVVIVSNEVGQGVVPSYPLGRIFRDVAGWANQRVAAAARQVYYCFAGIPVELKRLQQSLEG